ncbi:MAG: glycosyltransferase family 2 protein [Flavobacteriaceae bacterium]
MDIQFSVVIPLYNKEEFVAQTLKSVVGQTYQNFEVVIVNDYSNDNSLDVVKAIDDHRIKIIEHSENKGLSASRNTGISAATHTHIAFLDADDYWDSTFLETIVNLIKEYPDESVFATHYRENYNDKFFIPKSNLPISSKGKTFLVRDFFEINLGRLILTQSCIVVHKNVFEQIGYYDENVTFAEDIDFYIRCFHTYNLAYYNDVCHTQNAAISGSITNSVSHKKTFPKLHKYLNDSDSLDKFINFYTYCIYRRMKNESARKEMRVYRKQIKFNSLTVLQVLFIYLPLPFYLFLIRVKKRLLNKGYHVSSY